MCLMFIALRQGRARIFLDLQAYKIFYNPGTISFEKNSKMCTQGLEPVTLNMHSKTITNTVIGVFILLLAP